MISGYYPDEYVQCTLKQDLQEKDAPNRASRNPFALPLRYTEPRSLLSLSRSCCRAKRV